jgi:calcium-dependent protein kinase
MGNVASPMCLCQTEDRLIESSVIKHRQALDGTTADPRDILTKVVQYDSEASGGVTRDIGDLEPASPGTKDEEQSSECSSVGRGRGSDVSEASSDHSPKTKRASWRSKQVLAEATGQTDAQWQRETSQSSDSATARGRTRRMHRLLNITDTMGIVPSSALQIMINNPGVITNFYTFYGDDLGKGSYGVVKRAKVTATGALRAVKLILKEPMKDFVGALKDEVDTMKKLDHPYIIMLYEVFEDLSTIYLVMELCSGGHLQAYIQAHGHLNETAAATAMQQLFRAVCYLHRNFICHRDLKSENLLLSSNEPFTAHGTSCLKVADFGMATIFKPKQFFTKVVGTPSHMAPEVLAKKYNESCDYFACGCIMFLAVSGVLPFDPDDQGPKRFKYQFAPVWASISQEAVALVTGLLHMQMSKRMTAQKGLQDPWLLTCVPPPPDEPLTPEILERLAKFRSANRFRQAALSVVASMLGDSQVATCRRLFMCLDVTGDGLISLQELVDKIGEEKAQEIMKDNTTTGRTGKQNRKKDFTYLEFIAATFDRKKCLTQAVCKVAFSSFDRNKDGSISMGELVGGRLLGHLTAEEINLTLQDLDKNGDQEIDFREFRGMMRAQ